jgi:hypothetical protein
VIFSLNHLDLREVQRRQFLNMRVTWGIGCSSGTINTTRVNEESGNSPEQKEMQEVSKSSNIYYSCRHFESKMKRTTMVRVSWNGCQCFHVLQDPQANFLRDFQADNLQAFRANFNIYEVPEILATPCCSQIAVTRERIRSVPREQYKRHINWLLNTNLPDDISGRTWEHMWQHLFLQKAIDCPIEHKAYCLLYRKSNGVP